jgi:hypothetical protein
VAENTAMANKVRRRSHYSAISDWTEQHLYRANKTFLCENVIWPVYNEFSPIMPKKISTKETASSPVRVAKPSVSTPRVKTVKHSKAASAPAAIIEVQSAEIEAIEVETGEVETVTLSAHERISKIAYGYWVARNFEPGCPEQDWLRAEQEFLSA